MALTQTHYRFRTDANAVDATPTWGADEDASPSPATTPFRLRIGAYGTSAASGEFELYAQKNAGSYAAVTTSAIGGAQSYDASSNTDDTILRVPRLTLTSAWWLAGAAIDLDFSGNRIYPSGALTDYVSCSRASIGYAKNADGTLTQFASDTLRIGVGTGLLIEDSRTNTCTYSQDLTGASWTISNCTLASDNTTAPDGTTTADKLTITVSNANILNNPLLLSDLPAATAISCTAYLKVNSGATWAILNFAANVSGDRFSCYFNLSGAGSVGTSSTNASGTFTSASIESLANGWYRVCIVGQVADSTHDRFIQIKGNQSADNIGDNGAVVADSYFVWGVQAEVGAFPSSYIPTTTTAARAADVITNTGDLQTDIAAAVGSIVVQVNNGNAGIAANIVDSNGTNLLGFDGTNHGLASISATLATGNTANRTSRDKLGIAWDASGRSLVLNGGTVATDATAQTPSSTQHLGSSGTDNFASAYIERLTIWTPKLADAMLQGSTS